MTLDTNECSPVNQMFAGRSVFITGASGFIGRVLMEKLLRSYPGIKRIYILLRPKRNKSPKERLFGQVLKVPIFDKIRSMKNGQELLEKIVIVTGDISEANLGISEPDMQMMLNDESLSIVYHLAATVKFDEPLKMAIKFNLAATQSVIDLCKRLPNLISFCHVSTAYVNSNIKDNSWIEEKLYPMREAPQEMIKLADIMNEEMMQQLKPYLIGDRPNTYTYTKSLAEHLVAMEAPDLPVSIVRPSIVTASWKEPVPGWVDNINGPTGMLLAIGKGLLRSMYVRTDIKADIIPVDVVVNTTIAASYYAAKINNKLTSDGPSSKGAAIATDGENKDAVTEEHKASADKTIAATDGNYKKVPPIFHCNSGDVNPVTWGWMQEDVFPVVRRYPSQQVFRYPAGSFKNNRYHDYVTRLFVHLLPALIIDLLCLVLGKKRQLLTIYGKLDAAVVALESFTTQNFNFSSKNLHLLKECLDNETDQNELFMDISKMDWLEYFRGYVLGSRRYLLKESDDTLEASRKSFRKAHLIEIGFRILGLILMAACCYLMANRCMPTSYANNIHHQAGQLLNRASSPIGHTSL